MAEMPWAPPTEEIFVNAVDDKVVIIDTVCTEGWLCVQVQQPKTITPPAQRKQ